MENFVLGGPRDCTVLSPLKARAMFTVLSRPVGVVARNRRTIAPPMGYI